MTLHEMRRVDVRGVAPFLTCQPDRDTCWAGAEATLLNFFGHKITADALVEKWTSLKRPCGRCPKFAERKYILRAASRLLPRGSVTIDEDEDAIFDTLWDNGRFRPIQYLVNGLPFVLLFRCGGCSVGHAYVVTGATYSCSNTGSTVIDSLAVLDPDCEHRTSPIEVLTADVLRQGRTEVVALRPNDTRDRPVCL
jgi:hypothetical protein